MGDSLQCNRNTKCGTQAFDSHRRKRTVLADRPKRPWHTDRNGSQRIATEFLIPGKPASFIFATLDGTISAFSGVSKNQATIGVQLGQQSNVHGLGHHQQPLGEHPLRGGQHQQSYRYVRRHLYAEEVVWRSVDPISFSVFGIQDINGLVYVTYAMSNGSADGFVDVFKEDGTLVKTLIQGLPLNQAWGIALAPSNFGPLSNTLLVSNNSIDGTINGFNPKTGEFVGTIRDQHGKQIIFNQPWAIVFGGGTSANGATNELFVTVGPGIAGQNENAGIFASIVFPIIVIMINDDKGGPK